MTRTRRSLLSLAANYFYTATTLVVGLITTPLLLHWLGDERVGLFRVGQQWLGYATLFSIWVDSALMVHFARASAAGDRAALVETTQAGFRAFTVVGLLGMAWTLILAVFAPVLFNLEDPKISVELRTAYLGELRNGLLIFGVCQVFMALAVFRPLLDSVQRGYLVHLNLAIGTLAGAAIALTSAATGGGLAGQFAAFTLTPIIMYVLLGVSTLRRYPELLRRRTGTAINWRHSFDRAMFIVQICLRMSFLSDAIVIALVLGSAMVLPFTVTQSLFVIIQSAVVAVSNATWAAMANLHNSGQHEAFTRRLLQLTRLVTILAVALAVPAAVWNRAFVLAWVKEPHRYAGDLLSGLTATSLIFFCVMWL